VHPSAACFWLSPAIFCASTTRIERHEIRRKREAGASGKRRGQEAAAIVAAGAALGSIAMIAFAATFAVMVPFGAVVTFIIATITWITVAVGAWRVTTFVKCVSRRLIASAHSKRLPDDRP
jgi:hypothetical protein